MRKLQVPSTVAYTHQPYTGPPTATKTSRLINGPAASNSDAAFVNHAAMAPQTRSRANCGCSRCQASRNLGNISWLTQPSYVHR
ncbi:hypothetical protein E2C01_062168 [Portunus trituberculatus]|uniref:Uncharacterized protein n=1 Tax=Portunus trituberculatus TaxID=210409 RepID=A0A5B7HDU0_PORTR|nr:hypothetical protein [Portunus trituberculatus]